MKDQTTSAAAQTERYPLLFSPFRIRGVELRNRFVFSNPILRRSARLRASLPTPMWPITRSARGGGGLIITESQAIHPTGKMSRRFINAWDPATIPLLRNITDAVHSHGTKIFSQLTHDGHTSLEHPPHLMWAPTQMPEPSSHEASACSVVRVRSDRFCLACCCWDWSKTPSIC